MSLLTRIKKWYQRKESKEPRLPEVVAALHKREKSSIISGAKLPEVVSALYHLKEASLISEAQLFEKLASFYHLEGSSLKPVTKLSDLVIAVYDLIEPPIIPEIQLFYTRKDDGLYDSSYQIPGIGMIQSSEVMKIHGCLHELKMEFENQKESIQKFNIELTDLIKEWISIKKQGIIWNKNEIWHKENNFRLGTKYTLEISSTDETLLEKIKIVYKRNIGHRFEFIYHDRCLIYQQVIGPCFSLFGGRIMYNEKKIDGKMGERIFAEVFPTVLEELTEILTSQIEIERENKDHEKKIRVQEKKEMERNLVNYLNSKSQ